MSISSSCHKMSMTKLPGRSPPGKIYGFSIHFPQLVCSSDCDSFSEPVTKWLTLSGVWGTRYYKICIQLSYRSCNASMNKLKLNAWLLCFYDNHEMLPADRWLLRLECWQDILWFREDTTPPVLPGVQVSSVHPLCLPSQLTTIHHRSSIVNTGTLDGWIGRVCQTVENNFKTIY